MITTYFLKIVIRYYNDGLRNKEFETNHEYVIKRYLLQKADTKSTNTLYLNAITYVEFYVLRVKSFCMQQCAFIFTNWHKIEPRLFSLSFWSIIFMINYLKLTLEKKNTLREDVL